MCGIAGFYSTDLDDAECLLKRMLEKIHHRGPDSSGTRVENFVALGIRRLSVIDLEGGDQPIDNEDGSITIVFNGEIYNFRELRKDLENRGHKFSTHTDSEVIVHLYEEYGREAISHLNGMFAFCLYDRLQNKLILAKDRAGKKPLYYYLQDKEFVFGSEIKVILDHPKVPRDIDLNALGKYFTHGYVPAPDSLFQNIKKLPAGCILELDLNTLKDQVSSYWDFDYREKYIGEESQLILDLEETLNRAVKRRLVSDVPLGVFLSGGVDSSLVVALMSRHLPAKDIKTFSIGFEEKAYDESNYAGLVAKRFNTNHHLQIFNAKDAFDIIDEILPQLDEPISDPSIIPTYLLSKTTRQNGIIVALSGDGGDELFGGYPKYYIHRYTRFYDLLPQVLRNNVIQPLLEKIPLKAENNIFNYKVERFLANAQYPSHYRNQFWVSPFVPRELDHLLTGDARFDKQSPYQAVDTHLKHFRGNDLLDKMMYLDAKLMLQDMYLTKVDRASMAVSLEVRSPFLDKEVLEFSSTIPSRYKVRGQEGKYILKKVAEKHLPHEIIYRFKKGFGIPLAQWIKKLSSQIIDLLERHPTDIIDKGFVKQLLSQHMNGKHDYSVMLWSLYVFFRWYEEWFVIKNRT